MSTALAAEPVTIPGLDFVAIDFETANPKRASVCQIGVAKVLDGVITKTFTSYVTPPPGHREFGHRNVAIHGITARDLVGAPHFGDILDRLVRFTGDLPLVGHNVSVERSVIVQGSEALGLAAPDFAYLCTHTLAKHRLPGLASYRLNTLVDHLGLPDFGHHDAGEDAVACANLAIHLAHAGGYDHWSTLWPSQKRVRRD
ncbi:3'-5' exonuclease [Tersicoccus sp. MR15.9]|uniref:3'-5' exonuclease n=1 Tax=Tersicoccus mangrovi TaxID=3121635 RepID=UPI002FE587EE